MFVKKIKTFKAAVEVKDFLKLKTHQLIKNKDEEIVLHNDVIRSTTMYDEDGPKVIRQNELPKIGNEVFNGKGLEKNGDEFWQTKKQVDVGFEKNLTNEGPVEEKDDEGINII